MALWTRRLHQPLPPPPPPPPPQAARHDTSLTRWRQLFSYRKRKAILNCFLAVPYFELSRHRAINLFLTAYCCGWLTTAECTNHRLLSEELLDRPDFVPSSSSSVARQPQGSGAGPDPLAQLFTMFKRVASTQEWYVNRTVFVIAFTPLLLLALTCSCTLPMLTC